MRKIYLLLLSLISSLIFSQTYSEDFEGLTKNSYSSANVTLNSIQWNFMAALAGNSSSDWKLGGVSARLAGVNSTTANTTSKIEMLANKTGGIGNITFLYRQYGSDSQQIPWSVEWSSDGTTWTSLGQITATSTVQTFSQNLNQANARIRIIAVGYATGTTGKRINIDQLSLTDNGVAASTQYYLYNSSLAFNKVISSESSVKQLTVIATNNNMPITYSISGTDAAMFSANGSLALGGGAINVDFNPSSIGDKTATLTLSNGTSSKDIPLTGTGIDSVNPYSLSEASPVNSFADDFESYANNASVAGSWINYSQDENVKWIGRTLTTPVAKTGFMTSFGGNGYHKTLLISPAINIDQIAKSNVKFDWAGTFTTGATLNVYLFKLVSGQPMQKTLLKSITTGDTAGAVTFTTETLDLTSYSGIGFLAFEYLGNTVEGKTTNYYIDNVVITSSLATGDFSKSKINLVKNTMVKDVVTFGAKAQVKIINLNGQVIKSASVDNGASLDVSSLSKGVYIIKGEVNGETVSQKIIKQ